MFLQILKVCILLAATKCVIAQPTPQVSLDVYPDNGSNVELGARIVIVCRVVGVTAGTQLTYSWTCPNPSDCNGREYYRTDDNILQLDTFREDSRFLGTFTCTVNIGGSSYTATQSYSAYSGGPSLFNANPDFSPTPVFTMPKNSFVTNTTIPGKPSTAAIDAHVACAHATSTSSWYQDQTELSTLSSNNEFQSIDSSSISHLRIVDLAQYTNDEYRCVLGNGEITYLGVFLNSGALTSLSSPSNLQTSSITATSVVVSWDSVSGASGYYVGYDRQGFGIGTSTPSLFERVTGGTTVTLNGLSPGSQYEVTVWSTNGAGVSEGNATISSTTLEQAPSEPRSFMMISSTSTSIVFNWIPPKFPNGVIHYIIEYSTSSMFTSPSSVNTSTSSNHYTLDTTVLEFGGVTNYFRVVVVNSAGRSESVTTVSACYDTRPDPPSGLNGNTTVPSSLSLSWSVPDDRVCDDSGISSYTVMYRKKSDTGGVYMNTSSTMNSITLSNLESSTLYEVQVVAVNRIGASSTSNSVDVISGSGPPGTPENLTITSTTITSIAIMWTPPANNGGSNVTSYSVNVSGGTTSTITTTMTSTTISGLTENTLYTISVSAVNSVGPGSSAEVTESTLLSAPSSIAFTPQARNATLTWTSAGSSFSVTYRVRGETLSTTVNVSDTTAILTGLSPVTSYDVEIRGIDSMGRLGEVGSTMFTTLAAAPDAPGNLTVTSTTSTSIAIMWNPPANNGGSAVTNYSVMVSGGTTSTTTTTVTSTTIRELTPNTMYTISVLAVNSAGSGLSVKATETTLLSAPSSITAIPQARTATISWTSVGSTFTVTYGVRGEMSNMMTNVRGTTALLTGLSPVTSYDVEIRGIDSKGRQGEVGTTNLTTLAAAPNAPENLTITSTTSTSIAIMWSPPANNGGAAVISYSVKISGGTTSTTTTSMTSTTISGLTPNTMYTILVLALNSVGPGLSAEVTEATLLSAPSRIMVTPQARNATITWTSAGSSFSVTYRVRGGTSSTTVNVSNTTAILTGLSPAISYDVEIRGIDSKGRQGEVGTTNFTTLPAAPDAPEDVTITSTTSTSIAIMWTPPANNGGSNVTSYSVMVSGGTTITTTTTMTSTTISGLTPNTMYTISVSAVNSAGPGLSAAVTETTLLSAPSDITVTPQARNATITWTSAGSSFSVTYRVRGETSSTTVNVSDTTAILTRLSPVTPYDVEIIGIDSNGRLGEVGTTMFTTLPAAPDTPEDLTITSTTSTSIAIMWSPPANNGGSTVTSYSVMVSGGTTSTTTTTMTSRTISGLTPNTMYTISVSAVNSAGPGSSAEVTETTLLSAPSSVTATPQARNATITWTSAGSSFSVTYRVRGETSSTTESTNETTIVLTRLSPAISYDVEIRGIDSKGRQGEVGTTMFTTLPAVPETIPAPMGSDRSSTPDSITIDWDDPIINDDRSNLYYTIIVVQSGKVVTNTSTTESEYTIRNLDSNQEYNITITPVNSVGAGGPVFLRVRTDPITVPPTSSVPIELVVGVVVGVILLTVIIVLAVIVVILVVRCRKDDKYSVDVKPNLYTNTGAVAFYNDKETVDLDGNEKSIEAEPIEECVKVPTPVSVVIPEPQPASTFSNDTDTLSGPIPISKFSGYVRSINRKGRQCFDSEFKSIPMKTGTPHGVALLPQNVSKNRYKNIQPYDETRFVLKEIGSDGSDYINASFVDGYGRKDYYIAAQGPLPKTIVDFWKMIWETKSPMVVMLTKALEGGKVKCEQYFAEKVGDTYTFDSGVVKTISLNHYIDYELRVMEITKDGQCHTIDHYLFTGWPDYGVPQYPTSLLRMLYHVRERRISDTPIVVHCSAGVGRTGTFVVIDMMLDRMSKEGTLDIKGTVEQLRSKRMYMVQTLDQYIFLHNALHELILCGDTNIKAGDLRTQLANMKVLDPVKRKTGMEKEFEMVNLLSEDVNAETETESSVVAKCRYKDRLPVKGKYMYVSSLSPPAGSRGVNASYVDGYRAPKAFIAAQSPMHDTADDFWAIVYDKKVSIVVLLCNFEENGQETCHKFWPDAEDKPVDFGGYEVSLVSQNIDRDMSVYSLSLHHKMSAKKNTREVSLIHYKRWPEKENPITKSLLKTFTTAEKLKQSTSNAPVLVACNDGLGRTGTFIAFWTLIEQMKTERQIDVLNAVKFVRSQRPSAVPYLIQYIFCHEAVLEYVDSFEGYSNFS